MCNTALQRRSPKYSMFSIQLSYLSCLELIRADDQVLQQASARGHALLVLSAYGSIVFNASAKDLYI